VSLDPPPEEALGNLMGAVVEDELVDEEEIDCAWCGQPMPKWTARRTVRQFRSKSCAVSDRWARKAGAPRRAVATL
jgi:hypothetical protein